MFLVIDKLLVHWNAHEIETHVFAMSLGRANWLIDGVTHPSGPSVHYSERKDHVVAIVLDHKHRTRLKSYVDSIVIHGKRLSLHTKRFTS